MDKRMKEVVAMTMIGDGILSVLTPKRHCQLWQVGPKPYQEFIEKFVEHPNLTRLLGAVEAGMGVWLALQQRPGRQAETG